MRRTRSEMRQVDDQHTRYRGDWTEAHTNSANRSHHLETNNVGDIDQSCGHNMSRRNIGNADTTLPNRGRVNFNYGRFSSECDDGSSCYGRIHGDTVKTSVLAAAFEHTTPNTIDEKCLQTDAPSQVRICSAQDTLPEAHAPRTSLPLCLSGVRFHDHADGTTGARNHLANITSARSPTCDAVGNAAHNIDQTELEFNRSPGEESSSDRRRTDSYLADESDTNVGASLSSSVTSALSRAMLLLRRTADDTMEAAIRFTDVPPLKQPPSSRPSAFRFGHTSTPTKTQSSPGCVPSRSNFKLDVTVDNTAFQRTDEYNVGKFDRVSEMRNPSVDARVKPRQRSPSSSAYGCYLVRSESSIDQHCSVERQITELRRTIYNAPVRRDSLSDSHSSSSTITPDNVAAQPSD